MADKRAYGPSGGYGGRISVRRAQLLIGGFFAYAVVVSALTWLFLEKNSTSVWALLVGAPLAGYLARGLLAGLMRPLTQGGGREVARILQPLRSKGYEVMHDVDLGRASVGHIVFGPTGVYAIETRGTLGRFSLGKNGRLLRSGVPADKMREHAVSSAARVRNRLVMCGMDEFVTAVVAFTRASVPRGPLNLRPGYAIEVRTLEQWISRRVPNLQPPDLDRVRAALHPRVSA